MDDLITDSPTGRVYKGIEYPADAPDGLVLALDSHLRTTVRCVRVFRTCDKPRAWVLTCQSGRLAFKMGNRIEELNCSSITRLELGRSGRVIYDRSSP